MSASMAYFSAAEQVELECALLYRAVAERFAANVDFCALLLKIAGEEEEHASRLRLLRSLSAHDRRLTAGAQISVEDVQAFQAEIGVLRGVYLDQGKEFSELETRRTIVAIEERLAVVHANAVVTFADEKLHRFFEALAVADKGHAQMLVGATPAEG